MDIPPEYVKSLCQTTLASEGNQIKSNQIKTPEFLDNDNESTTYQNPWIQIKQSS